MWIRSEPFRSRKAALQNTLESPDYTHISSFFSNLQTKIFEENAHPSPGTTVQLWENPGLADRSGTRPRAADTGR